MANNYQVIDRGWKRITAEIKSLDNSYSKVGFPIGANVGPATTHNTPLKQYSDISEVASIALFNEIGTSSGGSARSGGQIIHVPPRPFMSTAFDEGQRALNTQRNKNYKLLIEGKLTGRQALQLLGLFHASQIKRKIQTIQNPPNAPSTIARKKSSNPLIDSAQMLNSVTNIEVFT